MRIGTVISIATLSVSTAALVLVLMLFITEPWESERVRLADATESQLPSSKDLCASANRFWNNNDWDHVSLEFDVKLEISKTLLAHACYK